MARQGSALAFALWMAGCALTPERLPKLDRRFYALLATPTEQAAFLRLRKEEQRREFLRASGLWKKWQALPEDQREAVRAGLVVPGFQEFALFMAWGPPADTQHRERLGRPAVVHTFIRCSSGPKAGQFVRNNLECDGTSEETQVSLQDGVVTEIRYPH